MNGIRKDPKFSSSIKFSYASTHEIGKIIKSVKTKISHGYDETSVEILKWSTLFINSPVT